MKCRFVPDAGDLLAAGGGVNNPKVRQSRSGDFVQVGGQSDPWLELQLRVLKDFLAKPQFGQARGGFDVGERHFLDGIIHVHVVAVGALADVEVLFADKAGADKPDARITGPDVIVIGPHHQEFDHYVIIGPSVARRHGVNFGDSSNGKAHQLHRVAHGQSLPGVGVGAERGLDFEPSALFGGAVEVVAETQNDQRDGSGNEPAHDFFHAAEAGAKLGC